MWAEKCVTFEEDFLTHKKIEILQQKFNEICSKISSHGFSTTPTCILTVLLHKESIKGLFVHNFHFWIAQDEQEKIIYLFRAHNAKLGLTSRTKYILSITYRRTNHVWKYFMDFEPNLTKNQKAYTKCSEWKHENTVFHVRLKIRCQNLIFYR